MTRIWIMVYGAVGTAFFLVTMLYAAGIAGSLLGSRPVEIGVRGGGRLLESIRVGSVLPHDSRRQSIA
jgi:hypothetical protein